MYSISRRSPFCALNWSFPFALAHSGIPCFLYRYLDVSDLPGNALRLGIMQVGLPIFQSTCPVRGTTHIQAGEAATVRISIHVPRAGHDERRIIVLCLIEIFQSTCPMRGTTSVMYFWSLATLFQSTCPMRGTTRPISSTCLR